MADNPDSPMIGATPKSRYSYPRVLLNWDKNDRLRVLKMLAWVVYDHEHVHNADALEARVDALCEHIMRVVLGEDGLTLAAIKEHTLAEQYVPITATKL